LRKDLKRFGKKELFLIFSLEQRAFLDDKFLSWKRGKRRIRSALSSLESKFEFDLTLPMLVLRNEVLEP